MQNILLVLQNVAKRDGFELSFEPVGSSHTQSKAHLVIMTSNAAKPCNSWLAQVFDGIADVYALSPDLTANTLKKIQRELYQDFGLMPKEFCDVIKAANLLAKIRVSPPASIHKLFLTSDAANHEVFKAFVSRTFGLSLNDFFRHPNVALTELEKRLPKVVSALVDHFTAHLSNGVVSKNEQALFLVFLREKPTQKTDSKNRLTKFLTRSVRKNRLASVNSSIAKTFHRGENKCFAPAVTPSIQTFLTNKIMSCSYTATQELTIKSRAMSQRLFALLKSARRLSRSMASGA